MKKYVTAAALLFLMIFSLQGCGQAPEPNSSSQNIKGFIERVLTVPDPGLSEVVQSDIHMTDMDEYDRQIRGAIAALCGEQADTEKLSDPGSRFYEQIILLHLMADEQDYTITVDRVEITESENTDKHFGYRAVVHDSREAEPVTLSGSVQLNGDYEIEYMSVN